MFTLRESQNSKSIILKIINDGFECCFYLIILKIVSTVVPLCMYVHLINCLFNRKSELCITILHVIVNTDLLFKSDCQMENKGIIAK